LASWPASNSSNSSFLILTPAAIRLSFRREYRTAQKHKNPYTLEGKAAPWPAISVFLLFSDGFSRREATILSLFWPIYSGAASWGV
jgi:hypothetical protein